MKKKNELAKADFAAALEALEKEIGIHVLGQLVAEVLLVCSARTVGDAPNTWTVKTKIVSGVVSANTDKGLANQTRSDIS